MAVNLGQLDIRVKADEQQIVKAQEKGGVAAGQKMAATVNQLVRGSAGGMVGGVAGGAARAAGGVAGGAAGRIAGNAAGGIGGIGGGIVAGGAAAAGGGAAGGLGAAVGGAAASAGGGGALLVIGAVLGALALMALAIRRITSGLMDDARRLAAVNGPLAVAEAVSAVMQIRRDIAAGAVIGQPLAALRIEFEQLKNIVAPIVNLLKLGAITAIRVFVEVLQIGAKTMRELFLEVVGMIRGVVFITAATLHAMSFAAGEVPFIGNDLKALLQGIAQIGYDAVRGIDEVRKQLQKMQDAQDVTGFNMLFLENIKRMTGGRLSINRDIRGVNVPDS